jgi:hypothetical protein
MHDTGTVRAIQGVRNLGTDPKHLARWKRPFRDSASKRLTLDQLHHEVVRVAFLPDVVEDTDVRMVQRGDGFRLAAKACALFGGDGAALRQDLDRYLTTQSRIAGAIHLAHAAGAEGRDNLIGAETGAGRDGHEGLIAIGQSSNSRERWGERSGRNGTTPWEA